jgi:hypothetical protein
MAFAYDVVKSAKLLTDETSMQVNDEVNPIDYAESKWAVRDMGMISLLC